MSIESNNTMRNQKICKALSEIEKVNWGSVQKAVEKCQLLRLKTNNNCRPVLTLIKGGSRG